MSIIKSFKDAVNGIINTVSTERNLKIQVIIMICVISAGLIVGLSNMEWIICIMLFGLVTSAELFNTSRFKKDEAEGLWRVNILTGEMEKLSGKMYEQLYIYDNSGIVACTFSKDIVKLDFDGRIIKYIVRGTVLDHLDEFWRNTFSKAE